MVVLTGAFVVVTVFNSLLLLLAMVAGEELMNLVEGERTGRAGVAEGTKSGESLCDVGGMKAGAGAGVGRDGDTIGRLTVVSPGVWPGV